MNSTLVVKHVGLVMLTLNVPSVTSDVKIRKIDDIMQASNSIESIANDGACQIQTPVADIPNTYSVNLSSHFDQMLSLEVRSRLLDIAKLQDNWNGYGAATPSPSALYNTKALLANINQKYLSKLDPEDMVPTPYGTILMEWKTGDKFVSVEMGDESVAFFSELKDNINLEQDSTPFNRIDVPVLLKDALVKLYC